MISLRKVLTPLCWSGGVAPPATKQAERHNRWRAVGNGERICTKLDHPSCGTRKWRFGNRLADGEHDVLPAEGAVGALGQNIGFKASPADLASRADFGLLVAAQHNRMTITNLLWTPITIKQSNSLLNPAPAQLSRAKYTLVMITPEFGLSGDRVVRRFDYAT